MTGPVILKEFYKVKRLKNLKILDVSGLSPQHDGTSHSEGILQSKMTEESKNKVSHDKKAIYKNLYKIN